MTVLNCYIILKLPYGSKSKKDRWTEHNVQHDYILKYKKQ